VLIESGVANERIGAAIKERADDLAQHRAFSSDYEPETAPS
jgi:hypothetical protein